MHNRRASVGFHRPRRTHWYRGRRAARSSMRPLVSQLFDMLPDFGRSAEMVAAKVLEAREVAASLLIRIRTVTLVEPLFFLAETGKAVIRFRRMQIRQQIGGDLRMTAPAGCANNVAPIRGGNRIALFPGRNRRIGHAEIAPKIGVAGPGRENVRNALHSLSIHYA